MERKNIQRIVLSPEQTVLSYHPNSSIVLVELNTTDRGFTVAMPEIGSNENRVFKFINSPQSGEGNDVIVTARSIMYQFTQWTVHPFEGISFIDNLVNTYLMINSI